MSKDSGSVNNRDASYIAHSNNAEGTEGLPLIDGKDKHETEARPVLFSFIMMTLCFSLNHGTVTAVIPLATSEFGDNLGNWSLGVLYFFYTVTALFFSGIIIDHFGHKWSLVLGCLVYTLYVAANFVGVLVHDELRWVIVILGSTFGGIAAGFLWTAQGGYFANAAKHHAKVKGIATPQATSFLGGVFATVYLALELIMKLLSSLVLVWVCGSHWYGNILTGKPGYDHPGPDNKDTPFIKHLKWKGVVITYLVFSVVALASTVGMGFIGAIKPMVDKDTKPAPKRVWYQKAMMAIDLMRRQPKIMLIGLINVAFGFVAGYLNSYVTGTVIHDSPALGKDKVGYFVSIIPLVATVVSMPLTKLTEKTGSKTPAMVIGMLCFLGFMSVFLITDLADHGGLPEHLGKWGILAPLFVVFGIGRAVWEGPNKAIMADMFKDDTEAAFAVLIFQLGTTSTFTFIAFANLPIGSIPKEIMATFAAAIAIPGYFMAQRIHKSQQYDAINEDTSPNSEA